MSRWLVLPMVVLAFSVTTVSGAAPRDRDHDGLPDRWERLHGLSIAHPSARGDPDRDGRPTAESCGCARILDAPTPIGTVFATAPRSSGTAPIRAGATPMATSSATRPRSARARTRAIAVATRPGRRVPERNPRARRAPVRDAPARDAPAESATGEQFPNRASTGTPYGWMPAMTVSTDLTSHSGRGGAGDPVHERCRPRGAAPNVVARGLEFEGGHAEVTGGGCSGDPLLIEDSTFGPEGSGDTVTDEPVTQGGNYVARRVEGINRAEGYRGSSCGPLRVEDSFMFIWAADSGTEACNETHATATSPTTPAGNFVNNTIVFKNSAAPRPTTLATGTASPAAQARSEAHPPE